MNISETIWDSDNFTIGDRGFKPRQAKINETNATIAETRPTTIFISTALIYSDRIFFCSIDFRRRIISRHKLLIPTLIIKPLSELINRHEVQA